MLLLTTSVLVPLRIDRHGALQLFLDSPPRGMAWDVGGKPLNDDTDIDFPGPPPWHPNCRTTLTLVVTSVGELVGGTEVEAMDNHVARQVKKLPTATQASMDGQVPKALTYEDWLKTKPTAFQEEVLGAGEVHALEIGRHQPARSDRPAQAAAQLGAAQAARILDVRHRHRWLHARNTEAGLD